MLYPKLMVLWSRNPKTSMHMFDLLKDNEPEPDSRILKIIQKKDYLTEFISKNVYMDEEPSDNDRGKTLHDYFE